MIMPYPPRHSATTARRRARRKRKIRIWIARVIFLFLFILFLVGLYHLIGLLLTRFFLKSQATNSTDGSQSAWYQEESLPAQGDVSDPDGIVVAIDPGHGGSDHGSQGINFYEDEMTWKTANLLMDLMEQDGRFSPFLTITQEQWEDDSRREKPSERAENIQNHNADLLLSIHGNSDVYPDTYGFECFPVPPTLPYHEESQRFAEIIAGLFGQDGQKLRGTNGVRYLYYDENDNKLIVESGSLQLSGSPTFTLLEDSGCPAVLVEQCFITNASDVDRYGDEDGCARAAQIYYQAICQYYGMDQLV